MSTTQSAMNHQDRLRWLAGLKLDCPCLVEERYPQCAVCTDIMGPGPHSEECLNCKGTGKVPRFPMLRQVCPACKGIYPDGTPGGEIYQGIAGCQNCGGRGFVPVDDTDATLEAARSIGFVEVKGYQGKGIGWRVNLMQSSVPSGYAYAWGCDEILNKAAISALYKVVGGNNG